jgi:hypothetical protein
MKMTVLMVYMVVGYRKHLNLSNPMSGQGEAMKQYAPLDGYVGRDLNIDRRSRAWFPIVVSS